MKYEDMNEEERKERDRLYDLSRPVVLNNQPERLSEKTSKEEAIV